MVKCVATLMMAGMVWSGARAHESYDWKRGVLPGVVGAASVLGVEYGVTYLKHLLAQRRQKKPAKLALALGYLKIAGEITTSEKYLDRIVAMAKTDEIRGLVVAIDTRGGSPGAAQALCKEIRRFAEKKPVVALIESKCLSAGYYIALGADVILSMPMSEVGSIGVRSGMYGINDLQYKVSKVQGGVEGSYEDRTLVAGEYKGMGDPYRPFPEEHKGFLQNLIDEGYDVFCKDVAQARGVDIENAQEWANGKVFTGSQAHKLKLIDGFGTIVDAEKVIVLNLKKRGITDISWPEDDDDVDVTFLDATPKDEEGNGNTLSLQSRDSFRNYGDVLITC